MLVALLNNAGGMVAELSTVELAVTDLVVRHAIALLVDARKGSM